MVRVPIACSLTADDAELRVGEWRELLSHDIRAVSGSGASLRLRLAGGDDVLLRVVDLAERERECCPFFDFSVQLTAEGRWLAVSVPPEATEILTGLLCLLPTVLRGP